MTCPGIEPGFTPWEGVVLTAWPTGRNRGDKIRTCDLCVPNAALYQTEPRLDVLERLFCAVYQRLVYNSMTLKKMQAFFWKKFNFLKKSFFGESSGIKKNLTKPYFIRKNSNRWVWESCAASRKKNVRKVHRNQKNRKETWKFNSKIDKNTMTLTADPKCKHLQAIWRCKNHISVQSVIQNCSSSDWWNE